MASVPETWQSKTLETEYQHVHIRPSDPAVHLKKLAKANELIHSLQNFEILTHVAQKVFNRPGSYSLAELIIL